ncbi:hypothetical protein WN944_019127 [Citrus x changshan-huyou]|uniref:NAC domain-containing protein n=1 Tax=Citrus x changshan-huyou TaxID=2935761 RepID=A0AAP0QG34_9ROSI
MGSLTGIGFRPLDEEIIDLLKKKRLDPGSSVQTIKEIDFYSFDPWELPGLSEIQSTEDVWYFFCKPKYKGAKRKRSGQQRHRKTKSGTWKMTGGGSEMKRKNSTEARRALWRNRYLGLSIPDPETRSLQNIDRVLVKNG